MTSSHQPNAGRDISMGVADKFVSENNRIGRLGLSPRQQQMNWLWSHYMCAQYDDRSIDWDGSEHLTHLEKVAISSGRSMDPGFYDANNQAAPLKFRRPTAPYQLCKVIVDRFTSLLFSEKRHPRLSIQGDPQSEDFIEAIGESGRLWATMMAARAYGGATGSVAVGFQFIDGRPYFEVHDSRWVFPHFSNRSTLELSAIEKRYVFFQEIYSEEDERYIEVPFWYRRVIDTETDVIFKPEPVGRGDEPDWTIDKMVKHKFGFCPVVWIQNLPVIGDIDGLPDCHGTYEMMEQIDALNSQAQRGVIANCDPTLVISSEGEMDSVSTGSDKAIHIPGGSVSYLELQGAGAKAARETAKDYRSMILEVCQCFLEGDQSGSAMTATEVDRRYSSMLAKADILREQYGERGVKPLMRKVLAAVKKMAGGSEVDGVIMRTTLNLPPKVLDDGSIVKRQLGAGPYTISLSWPRYFEPSLVDIGAAVTAAAGAKAAALVDDEHASKFVAEYFSVDDLPKMLEKIKAKADELGIGMEDMINGEY